MKKNRFLIAVSFVLVVAGSVSAAEGVSMDTESGGHGSDLVPLNAKLGECYEKVFIPAQYQESSDRVVHTAAGERLEIIPAEYRTVTREVVVRPESYKLVVVPATYRTVEEEIMVSPERTVLNKVPETYKTVEEEVLVRPASTAWKKGRGPIEKTDHSTGEIMCLVEVPAVYETVKRHVVDQQATTRETTLPAAYKTVTKTVLDQEATTQKVVIPAVTKTVDVTELVTAASVSKIVIPETFQTVEKFTLVKDSRLEWLSILCETNMNAGTITSLQQALQELGFYDALIDGIFGDQTKAGVVEYQKSKGLPSGPLTIQTLRSIGVL